MFRPHNYERVCYLFLYRFLLLLPRQITTFDLGSFLFLLSRVLRCLLRNNRLLV